MRRTFGLVLVFVLLAGLAAVAADNPAPPKYLWISFEQVKPGGEAAYMQSTQVFKDAMGQHEHYWLAGMPIAGVGNEFVYVAFLDNFASMDKMLADFMKVGEEAQKKNASLMTAGMSAVSAGRSLVAKFEPELSFGPEDFDAAQITRWEVTTYVLRPGTRAMFVNLLKKLKQLHAKDNAKIPVTVYRVEEGQAGPVFLIVRHLKTLADLDSASAPMENPVAAAMIDEQVARVVGQCVLSQTGTLYAILPALSYPPRSYVASNPDFWTVKPAEPVVATAPRKAKKVAEPAAIKEKEKP